MIRRNINSIKTLSAVSTGKISLLSRRQISTCMLGFCQMSLAINVRALHVYHKIFRRWNIFTLYSLPTPRSCSFFPFYTFHAVLCFSFVAVMLFGFLQKIVLSKLEVISSLAHRHIHTRKGTKAKACWFMLRIKKGHGLIGGESLGGKVPSQSQVFLNVTTGLWECTFFLEDSPLISSCEAGEASVSCSTAPE